MSPLRHFYNMKIGIVDLSPPSAVTIPLDPEQARKHIGGIAMNRELLSQHDDALVFGTGPLTGSFAPASSLLTATFISPICKHVCHVPFMLRTGPAMKFSGIDFLAVKGTAPELSVIYVNRGNIQVRPAGELRSVPAQDIMSTLKKEYRPYQTALVTGPAADHGVSHASVSVENHGSLDKAGLASSMAAKNLKGIVFSGTGGLPFGSDNPDQGKELIQRISADRNFTQRGFAAVLRLLDGGKAAGIIPMKAKQKDMACYNCPSPCITHVSFPRRDLSLLLLDHMGVIALAKKTGMHTLPLLRRCLQFGFDPAGVARRLPDGRTESEWISALEKMLTEAEQDAEKDQVAAEHPHTSDVPVKNHALFGGGIAPIPPLDTWDTRVGLAMILGICPLFLLRFPRIADTDLLRFISQDEATLATLQKNLASSISSVISD